MEIRMLQLPELLPALHLVWEVFAEDIAPECTPEGVASFQRFIKYDYISEVWQRGNLVFFGAYEEGEMCGTLAIRPDGHIALFFVKKQWQHKGVGRMLFQSAYLLCEYQLGVSKMTVNATPNAVERYIHMGMHAVSDVCEKDGLRYVPMERYVTSGGMAVPKQKKSKAPWIALGAFGAFLILLLIVTAVVALNDVRVESENRRREAENPYGYEDGSGLFDGSWWQDEYGEEDENDDSGESTLSGIDAISEYMADDLSYEIDVDEYVYSGEDMQSTMIEFSVSYPKITGLADEEAEQKVNEALKNTAKETVVRLYENPSPEVKERVMGESTPMLINYVTYKVCYASEDFISVVYDDYGYEGSQNYYAQHLRTCNISLKDGTVYEVKDIVGLNDYFIEEWLSIMRQEANNDASFLSELNTESLRNALAGDSQDGIYEANFFLYEDGIEIGFDLNYESDDPANRGYVWVTAPFSWDEIGEYASDSAMWDEIDESVR